MARAHHPRGAVDVEAGVQAAGDERLAGVDADPHPDRLVLPGVLGERPLRLRCSEHRLARIGEGEVEGVALHLHLHSAVAGEGLAEQAAVVLERPYVRLFAELLQQPRRALDSVKSSVTVPRGSSAMAEPAQAYDTAARVTRAGSRCHGGDVSSVARANDSRVRALPTLWRNRKEGELTSMTMCGTHGRLLRQGSGLEDCGRLGRRISRGFCCCVLLLFVLALGASSGTSAAVGVTFTVNSTGDLRTRCPERSWNGVCATSTGVCTLRAAIQESNASLGSTDTIGFNIPQLHRSSLASELPLITDSVVIDGTTQPGFVDKPIVELRGDAPGCRKPRDQDPCRRHYRSRARRQRFLGPDRGRRGRREPQAGDGVRIVGNYLGTDLTGTIAAGGNANGIHIIGGSDHVIGGPDPADRNVISGNGFAGIGFNGPGKVTIQGNFIGTNASGDAAVTRPASHPRASARGSSRRVPVRSSSVARGQGRAT